jgi:hypothetical protein
MINQTPQIKRLSAIILGLCLSTILILLAYPEEAFSEKWIGHYMYPGHDDKFPIYLDIRIQGVEVEGESFDGNMERATVTGSVENGFYNLLLHPVKHGDKTNQDVYYRGKRTGDSINGEWEHVVGVTGPWVSTITALGPEKALEPYTTCE